MNKVLYLLLSAFFAIFNQNINAQLTSLFNLEQLQQSNTNAFAINIEAEIGLLDKKKAEQEGALKKYKSELNELAASISSLKEKSKKAASSELEFINQQMQLLNGISNTLVAIEHTHQQIIITLDNYIKLLQEYKSDPDFKSKQISIGEKSLYTFDDLQKIQNLLLEYTDKLKTSEENLKKAFVDLEIRKKTQQLTKQEYDEKKREQTEFKNKDNIIREVEKEKTGFSISQIGELLDGQEKLLRYKKELSDLQVKEIDNKIRLLDEQIKILTRQLEIVNNTYDKIKGQLRIDDKDIRKISASIERQQVVFNEIQKENIKKAEGLDTYKEEELNKITQFKEKAQLTDSDVDMIASWTYQPKTIESWNALLTIGILKNTIDYRIDINKEYALAQIELERAKVSDLETSKLILLTWKKILIDKISHDEILKEIKHIEKERSDLLAHVSVLADQKAAAAQRLNNTIKIADNIKERIKEIKEQKNSIFKNNINEYTSYLSLLNDELADELHKRAEDIAHLVEIYTTINAIKLQQIKKIDSIIEELKLKAQWRTAPPLWKGLKNFIPDISKFFRYLSQKSIAQSFVVNKNQIVEAYNYYTKNFSHFLYLLIQIAIIFLIYFLAKLYLPDIKNLLILLSPQFGIGHTIVSFAIVGVSFLIYHLRSIFLWGLIFIGVKYNVIKDTYTGVLFFLASIPFWIIKTKKFIEYLSQENVLRGYIFVNKKYQMRFITVLSIFLYSTIFILFFRQAFIYAHFGKSPVPTLLLAFNFILLQISIICCMSKEQILSLIPRTTPLWQWIYEHVKKYYYVFLTASLFVIIMSNPYVGYGPEFFRIVTRLLLIALVVPFFVTIHNQLKRISGTLFFYSEGDAIKERFIYSRTFYGFFVICSFLFFITLAFLISANILGYGIGFQDIGAWLHKEIYSFKDPNTGRSVDVNYISISKVLLYIVGGMVIAYIINRFLLRRMFDLLLVNIGIQNAILSITRYIIILVAIIVGLQSIGLSTSLLYVFAVLGGLGVAGKEFISDFIGYFVILIQRPIKIGDLIRIDNEVTGIVRHITLRSVVLRRKNSVTIIIPNSHVMTKPVTNWSYSRTFFAFDDILLTIPYSTDVAKAKELILKVLYTNINILKNPAPIVWLNDFTDNGFQFLVRGFLSPDKVLEQHEIASEIRFEIVRILRLNNMEVASPTRVLKVVGQMPSNPLTPEL